MKIDEQYFIDLIDAATDRAIKAEELAPTRGGWDPVFRKRIESKMQVSRAWTTTVQSIIAKAKFYGIELDKAFTAGALEDE
jgi:hypothetical protein